MAPRFHESKTPHFFKVILNEDDHLQHSNLRIPKKFVRAHEKDFTDRVCLEVAGGDTWDVKLFKQDGEFLLQDGWADFMRHYDIKHGHFVIFRYEGESKFHVVICDVTACEINYPPKPTAPCDCDTAVQELKFGAKLGPHVFRVVIQPSALTNYMNIPVSFMREHLEQKVGRAKTVALNATLKVMKKSWPVMITSRAPKYNRYRIVKAGWLEFATENELQRGDTCVFTLVNMEWVFLVSIERKG